MGTFGGIEGIFAPLNGLLYKGYEIHMGLSGTEQSVMQSGNVYGTYIHGIFDENGVAETIVRALYEKRGLAFSPAVDFDVHAYKERQYELLAASVREALDMEFIYKILEEGV